MEPHKPNPNENEDKDFEEEEEEYGDNLPRNKRASKKKLPKDAVKRKLKQQRQELRDTVNRAKNLGGSFEYHGEISRSTLVGFLI